MKRLAKPNDHVLVVAGQSIGQLALLAVTPILTRAFVPAELGIYQVALAIALVIQPLATLRHEWILPVSQSASATRAFLRRAQVSITIVSSILLASSLAALLLGDVNASRSLCMVALITLAYAVTAVDNAVLIRSFHLRKLALRNLLAGLTASLLQLMVALFVPNALLIAGALLVGRLFAVIATRIKSNTIRDIAEGAGPTSFGPKRMAIMISTGLVSGSSQQGLTLVIAGLLGSASGAFVATALRVSVTPTTLLGQGIGQSVQATTARCVNSPNERLSKTVLRAGLWLSAFGVSVCVGLISLGPVLAEPILGSQWGMVGTLLPIIAVPVMFQIVVSPLGPVLVMIGSEGVALWLNVLRLVASIGAAAWTAIITRDLIGSVVAFSIATSLCYALHLTILSQCVRNFDRKRASQHAPAETSSSVTE